jgi:PKD repeat protein
MKNRIIKTFIIGLALTFETFICVSQVIQTESFDGTTFPPAGWDATTSGPGGSLWVRRTTGTNPTCATHSGAAMARFSSFNTQPGAQEVLTTPLINLIGSSGSQATISLWVYRDNSSTAGDSVTIFVNTSNSLTNAVRIGGVARSRFFVLPVNELANGWYNYTFNIPSTFNTDTNYVLMRGTARGGGHVYIDDVQWTEYPTACSSPVAGGVAATDSLICGGTGSVNLSLTGSGLTGGGLTFQWQSATDSIGPWTDFGTSVASLSSGNISVNTWFRCVVNCTAGSVTDSSSATLIEVSSNPVPVVTLNVGPTINYCTQSSPVWVAASGALTYTWSPAITTNAAGDSAEIAPAFTSTYTITGYDSLGCSASTSVTFNVTNSPTVVASTFNDTICEGSSTNLNAFVQGPGFGIQYQWQPGSLTGAQQTVSPTSSTSYVVFATSNQTGCTGRDTVFITVNPSPVGAFSFLQNNLTYSFSDLSTGAPTSWLWNFGDGATDTTQNPVHTYAANGTYTVTLTVSNGLCSNVITQTLIVVSVSELQMLNGSPIILSPNPAKEGTVIKFLAVGENNFVSVFNALGELIYTKEIIANTTKELSFYIKLNQCSPGIYFVRVESGSDIANLKIIKE